MSESPDPSNSPAAASIQMILFGAFVVSHLLLAGIGVFMQMSGGVEIADGAMDLMLPVLGVVAVSTLVATFTAVPMFLGDSPYQVYMIMRFAFAESITIFGLVLAMSGVPLEYCAAFWGVGLATHLTLAPTQRDRELHAERRVARAKAK